MSHRKGSCRYLHGEMNHIDSCQRGVVQAGGEGENHFTCLHGHPGDVSPEQLDICKRLVEAAAADTTQGVPASEHMQDKATEHQHSLKRWSRARIRDQVIQFSLREV